MKKKGMLLATETLKMILAVIGIAFLAYLLVSLYFSSSNSEKKQQATILLNKIVDVSSTLNAKDNLSQDLYDLVPSGWAIFSYTDSAVKPNQCAGSNCLCICDDVYSYGGIFGDRQLKECSNSGVCHVFSNLINNEKILIGSGSDPTSIQVYRYGEFLGVKKI